MVPSFLPVCGSCVWASLALIWEQRCAPSSWRGRVSSLWWPLRSDWSDARPQCGHKPSFEAFPAQVLGNAGLQELVHALARRAATRFQGLGGHVRALGLLFLARHGYSDLADWYLRHHAAGAEHADQDQDQQEHASVDDLGFHGVSLNQSLARAVADLQSLPGASGGVDRITSALALPLTARAAAAARAGAAAVARFS